MAKLAKKVTIAKVAEMAKMGGMAKRPKSSEMSK